MRLKNISEPAYLSQADQHSYQQKINALGGAVVCLAAGLIHQWLFPAQYGVRGFIFLLGIVIIATPIMRTAIKGLRGAEVKAGMELLVSITIIVATLSGEFLLAIVIPVILSLVHFLEEKSIIGGQGAIDGLKQLQGQSAVLLADGHEQTVDAKTLSVGDVIVVRAGTGFPVDGRVVFGSSAIDQASLTGESEPRLVAVGDGVFAGSVNLNGLIHVEVEKTYADTSFQKIVDILEASERMTLPETKVVDQFMAYYIPLVLAAAFITWLFTGEITRAIAILVASCPSGHLLISSAPMIGAIATATKKGILIKNAAFLEYLARTTYVVFDKTGTLTKGTLEAEGFYLLGETTYDELISTAGALAHASLHPVAKSIMTLCQDTAYDKHYTITEHIGKGLSGRKDTDTIYLGNRKWLSSLGYTIPDQYEALGTCDWVVKNQMVLGCLLFRDSPREEAKAVIADLQDLATATCLLTGDKATAAKQIQQALGIESVYHELLPEEKLSHVETLMTEHIVTVVGDGINDSLALSKAHVGIAMGAMGSDTAIHSADIALMTNNLTHIPFAIRLSQRTRRLIYQNLVLSFSMSAGMIFLGGAGLVSPVLMAFVHNIGAFAVLVNSGRVLRVPTDNVREVAHSESSFTDLEK